MTEAMAPRHLLAARIAFAAVLLVGWHFAATAMGDLFLASPFTIAARFVETVLDGVLLRFLVPTLIVLGVGFGAALAVGIPFGLVVGRWRRLYWLTEAPVNLFYSTPLVALIPVILVIMGFGAVSKIFIVFLFAVLPTLINTSLGVRTVDHDLLELARAFNSSERALWRDVLVPSALPAILTGARLAVGRALIGAVVAEFYAGASGVGYMITQYSNRFDIAGALVPVVVLVALGVASTAALKWLQRRLTPWQVAP